MKSKLLLSEYNCGNITELEFFYQLVLNVSKDKEDKDFVFSLPNDIFQSFEEYIISKPTQEEDWAKMQTLCVAMYHSDAELIDIRRQQEEEKKLFKIGVEYIRLRR